MSSIIFMDNFFSYSSFSPSHFKKIRPTIHFCILLDLKNIRHFLIYYSIYYFLLYLSICRYDQFFFFITLYNEMVFVSYLLFFYICSQHLIYSPPLFSYYLLIEIYIFLPLLYLVQMCGENFIHTTRSHFWIVRISDRTRDAYNTSNTRNKKC